MIILLSKLLADLGSRWEFADIASLLFEAIRKKFLETSLAPEKHAPGAANVDLESAGALPSLADVGAVLVRLRRLLRLLLLRLCSRERRLGRPVKQTFVDPLGFARLRRNGDRLCHCKVCRGLRAEGRKANVWGRGLRDRRE